MNKVDHLHILISSIIPDIIFISETWLCAIHDDSLLGLSGYSLFRADRGDGIDPHGGVLVAVKTVLNPSIVAVNTYYELLLVDISRNNCKIRLCVFYRPPSMNSTNSIASFDFLKRYIDISYPVCVVGDFNLPSI